MSRRWMLPTCAFWAVSALSHAQQTPPSGNSTAQQAGKKIVPPDQPPDLPPDQLPPDEDKSSQKQETVPFNPVTSKHDVVVGDEYFKKGNFRAAAARYRDATKSNDGNAEAWLRLGDAEERMHDAKAAREAWEKFLQLAPEEKRAEEVKKKLAKLKS